MKIISFILTKTFLTDSWQQSFTSGVTRKGQVKSQGKNNWREISGEGKGREVKGECSHDSQLGPTQSLFWLFCSIEKSMFVVDLKTKSRRFKFKSYLDSHLIVCSQIFSPIWNIFFCKQLGLGVLQIQPTFNTSFLPLIFAPFKYKH